MRRSARRREAGFGEGRRAVGGVAGMFPAMVLAAMALPVLKTEPGAVLAGGAALSFALCLVCAMPGYYTAAPEIGFGAAVVAWIAAVVAFLICGYVEARPPTTALVSLGAGTGLPTLLLGVWWVLEARDRRSRPT